MNPQLMRCCADLGRYARTTTHEYRGLYASLRGMCDGVAMLPSKEDQQAVLERIRQNLEDQNAPHIPQSCR